MKYNTQYYFDVGRARRWLSLRMLWQPVRGYPFRIFSEYEGTKRSGRSRLGIRYRPGDSRRRLTRLSSIPETGGIYLPYLRLFGGNVSARRWNREQLYQMCEAHGQILLWEPNRGPPRSSDENGLQKWRMPGMSWTGGGRRSLPTTTDCSKRHKCFWMGSVTSSSGIHNCRVL